MDKEQVNRTLRHMERLREDIDEAENETEARRLKREYAILSQAVRPVLLSENDIAAMCGGKKAIQRLKQKQS